MGLFFRDKSSVAKIEELNSIIENKNKEIEQLKAKIIDVERNSLSVAELEMIQNRIEAFTNENKNLRDRVVSLEKELMDTESSNFLKEKLEKSEREVQELSEKNSSLLRKIDFLEEKIANVETSSVSPKQMEIMERSLKSARKENLELKEKLSHYQEVANEVVKIEVEQKPMEFSDDVIILDKFKYKILTEDFYNATKFKDIREFLIEKNYLFINDIESLEDIGEIRYCKNFDSANLKFENFKKGKVSIEDRILLCKGAKVQKIFKSFRKFSTYLTDNNIEFMDELADVDLRILSGKANILTKTIKDVLDTSEKYFKENKI
ncbi:hypothetical protein [Fusobacterium sp.]|uniref:hypothetical protein n=1 Tax=Fusobacterium sp. TaxID=68766 RepID=UPI00261ABF73|nr:hypothetical protein [Fusobacterium sp.]